MLEAVLGKKSQRSRFASGKSQKANLPVKKAKEAVLLVEKAKTPICRSKKPEHVFASRSTDGKKILRVKIRSSLDNLFQYRNLRMYVRSFATRSRNWWLHVIQKNILCLFFVLSTWKCTLFTVLDKRTSKKNFGKFFLRFYLFLWDQVHTCNIQQHPHLQHTTRYYSTQNRLHNESLDISFLKVNDSK